MKIVFLETREQHWSHCLNSTRHHFLHLSHTPHPTKQPAVTMIAYILSKVTASLIGVMFLFAGGQKFTGLGPMAAELQQHFLKFGPAWGLPGVSSHTSACYTLPRCSPL